MPASIFPKYSSKSSAPLIIVGLAAAAFAVAANAQTNVEKKDPPPPPPAPVQGETKLAKADLPHSAPTPRKKTAQTPGGEKGCKAEILVDSQGKVLHAHNSDLPVPPASTIKLLTIILAERHLPPDAILNVGLYNLKRTGAPAPGAMSCDPNSPPDKIVRTTVRESMFLAGIVSSNPHAVALMEAIEAKTGRPFADIGTEFARKLGMNNTRIVEDGAGTKNAVRCKSGENQNQFPATDGVKLAMQIDNYPILKEILSQDGIIFEGKFYHNTNHLSHIWAKTGTVDGWKNLIGWDPETKTAFALFGCKSRFNRAKDLLSAHATPTDYKELAKAYNLTPPAL